MLEVGNEDAEVTGENENGADSDVEMEQRREEEEEGEKDQVTDTPPSVQTSDLPREPPCQKVTDTQTDFQKQAESVVEGIPGTRLSMAEGPVADSEADDHNLGPQTSSYCSGVGGEKELKQSPAPSGSSDIDKAMEDSSQPKDNLAQSALSSLDKETNEQVLWLFDVILLSRVTLWRFLNHVKSKNSPDYVFKI